jgi:hypothetical protein
MNTDEKQKPTVGRIVHFVNSSGHHWPAVIQRVWSDILIDLTVFTGDPFMPIVVQAQRLFHEDGTDNVPWTWHWPERI